MAGFGKRMGGDRLAERGFAPRPVVTSASTGADVADAYVEDDGKKHAGGLVFAILLTFIVVGGGAAVATTMMQPPAPLSAAQMQVAEDKLATHPGIKRLYDVLKTRYPATHADLLRKTSAQLSRDDYDGALATAMKTLQDLAKREMHHLDHADAASLGVMFRDMTDLMAVAQKSSPELCGNFAFEKLDKVNVANEDAVLNAAGRWTGSLFDAIYAGKTRPVTHKPATHDDSAMLGRTAIAQGLTLAEAQNYQARGGVKNMPPAEKCALALKVFRALLATPEPARGRLLGQISKTAVADLNL